MRGLLRKRGLDAKNPPTEAGGFQRILSAQEAVLGQVTPRAGP
jgi:hypothetical protein